MTGKMQKNQLFIYRTDKSAKNYTNMSSMVLYDENKLLTKKFMVNKEETGVGTFTIL
jgi:aspartyl aminopeptidase